MVAAATARARAVTPNPTPGVRNPKRSAATWVLIGIPTLLIVTLVWQLASGLLHTEIAVREAVAVGRATLETDPAGSRVDFVVVDRVGQETTVHGTVSIKLREPDGGVWQASRSVAAGDFKALPDGSLLAGRTGYSVVIPANDWARPPRRGGAATVTIKVEPADGAAFSTVAEERFP
jgi:hypothetical protein